MATKAQALKARDEAFDRLNRLGTVVLQARPVQTDGAWSIEIDVAHTDLDLSGFDVDGVPVLIRAHNRPRRRAAGLRPAGGLA